MSKLNLGCGKVILDDYVNLDIVNLPGVDIVHDLNIYPLPFDDDTFDEIYCDNVLEHLDTKNKVLEELWRIGKKDSKIIIKVPIFPSHLAFTDPTHKQFFTYYTFDYFEGKHSLSYYTLARFDIVKKKIIFWRFKKWMNYIVNLSTFFQRFYYNNFAGLIKPDMLYIELKVIK